MIALFVGVYSSYANETKIKKVTYGQNIIYEGEALKSGKLWIPNGKGTLYFSRSNIMLPYLNPEVSYFKIEGVFSNTKVTSAILSSVKRINGIQGVVGEITTTSTTNLDDKSCIFEGELDWEISSLGKMSYGDITISFVKGRLFKLIEEFSPFSIEYGPQKYDVEVDFTAMLSNSSNMKIFDPYGIKSGINYSSTVEARFFIGAEDFQCSVNTNKVIWEDGAKAEIRPIFQITRGNTRWYDVGAAEGDQFVETGKSAVVAVYNDRDGVVYPIDLSDHMARGFRSNFSRILSDGTIVGGVHENNIPHVRLVKCIDGRIFKGVGHLGVVIKGGETMKTLFNNNSLTKDNIQFVNGTLYDVEGEEVDSFGDGIGKYGEFPHF